MMCWSARVAVRVPVRAHEHDRLVGLAQLVEGYDHAFEDAAVLGGVVERATVGNAQAHADAMQAVTDHAALAAHAFEAHSRDVRADGLRRFCVGTLYGHVSPQSQGKRDSGFEAA